MKRFLVLLVICYATTIFALDHSGTITSDEWWDNVHSHYIVGNLTVADGVTLTIEAGTLIRFYEDCFLQINGTLIADGTFNERITFTSRLGGTQPGFWQNITFSQADAGCVLNYCDIYYGGSVDGLIYLLNSGNNVHITNCDIQYSGTSGVYFSDYNSNSIENCVINNHNEHGIYCSYSNAIPSISNCEIKNNGSYGIYCSAGGNPAISDCSIQNNGNYAIRTYGDNVKNITGDMTISGNTNNSIYVVSDYVDSGTWLNHGVDYVIGGNITVNNTRTLTINAGNTLKFDGNYYFQINGILIANGTSENRITFTSNQTTPSPGNWRNLCFINADSGCSLNYCDILYGGSVNGAIYSEGSGSNVSFSNCSFRYSGTKGFYLYDSPVITNCTISDNIEHGIYCVSSLADPPISDCIIQNNGDYVIRTYGNNVKNITGDMTISGNTKNSIYVVSDHIENSGIWNYHGVPYIIGGNMIIDNGRTLTINAGNSLKFNGNYYLQVNGKLIANGISEDRITFTSNQATPSAGNWQSIFFYYADTGCSLNYCDILYGGSETNRGMVYIDESDDHVSLNNCNIEHSQYAGIFLWANSAPSIINCVIRNNNQYGIRIYGHSSHPTFGSNLTEWNDIYDNNGGGVGRSFRNSTTNNTAEYIYWGTIVETEIDALIYDHGENSSLGTVDFTPWTNAAHDTIYPIANPDPPQNVTISISSDSVLVSWSPVLNASSYNIYSSDDPYAPFEIWTLEPTGTGITETSWSEPVSGVKKFYYVTAE